MACAWIEALKSKGYAVSCNMAGFYGFKLNGELHEDRRPYLTEGDAWAAARAHWYASQEVSI